jgi:hypothetical protein
LAKNRVIFEENSERIAENTKYGLKPGTSHFFSQFENREEQGAPLCRNRVRVCRFRQKSELALMNGHL